MGTFGRGGEQWLATYQRRSPPDRRAGPGGEPSGRFLVFLCIVVLMIGWIASATTAGAAADVAPPADAEAAASPADGVADYTFGVFPYLPPLSLDRVFAPVVRNLSEVLGRPVHLRTKETFAAFLAELPRGTYDFAFVHPYFYVAAVDQYAYLPVVRLDEPLTAVVVAREPSPLRALDDLRGRILALPPELAAVTELMRLELLDADLIPGRDVTLRHFQSKASCLHAIDVGDAAGCGVPRFALRQLPPEETKNLRIVFESRPVPGVAIVAHQRVPEPVRERLRAAILSWPASDAGRAILAEAEWPGFVAAQNADYDEIRHRLAESSFGSRRESRSP